MGFRPTQASMPAHATLSSSLLSDAMQMMSGQASMGGMGGMGAMGGAMGGGGASPREPSEAPTTASSPPNSPRVADTATEAAAPVEAPSFGPMPSLSSVLDEARGLLVDMGLADAACQPQADLPAGGHREVCPEMGYVASARALASMLAGMEPTSTMLPPCGSEAIDSTASGLAALPSMLGLPARGWDERGFEVYTGEGGGAATAIGLTSSAGLLGAAVQWPAQRGTKKKAVSVVVLTNELSVAMVPARLVGEVASALELPSLASFQG